MSKDFKFYENTICFSFEDSRPDNKGELKSDLLLYGNGTRITNGLIEKMNTHPALAEIITMAAFNFLERSSEPKKTNT